MSHAWTCTWAKLQCYKSMFSGASVSDRVLRLGCTGQCSAPRHPTQGLLHSTQVRPIFAPALFAAAAQSLRQKRSFQPLAVADDVRAIYQHREEEREAVAIHTFNIRGVSFDGRQEFLKHLDRGEAVMLVPEPENEHDRHAIAIKLLDGTSLGYVPRDVNQSPLFPRPGHVTFGHVRSVGNPQSSPEMHGAIVEHRPALVPLHAPAIPRSLLEDCQEVDHFLESGESSMAQEAKVRAAGRCQISGVGGVQLLPSPLWREDPLEGRIVLEGVRWVAASLREVQQRLLDEPVDPDVLWAFQAMNGWIRPEAQAYRAHQIALRSTREGEKRLWSLAGLESRPRGQLQVSAAASNGQPAKRGIARNSKPAEPPKNARNAYLFFSLEERPKVRQERPELKFAELNKELGARWRNADATVRGKYQKLADKDKVRFTKEQAAWEAKKPAGAAVGTKKAASAAGGNNKAESFAVNLKDAQSTAEHVKGKATSEEFQALAKELSKNLDK